MEQDSVFLQYIPIMIVAITAVVFEARLHAIRVPGKENEDLPADEDEEVVDEEPFSPVSMTQAAAWLQNG